MRCVVSNFKDLLQVIEVRWALDVGGFDVPRIQLAVGRCQFRPAAAAVLDFAVDFFKHGWNDVFLLNDLDLGSGRPYVLQEYRAAVGLAALKIIGISGN